MTYKKSQEIRQIGVLNEHPELFSNDPGMGEYKRIPRPFAVKDGINNLYSPIREGARDYFKENGIAWWGGEAPTTHMLSSQIACLNHLFAIKEDPKAVLSIANNLRHNLHFKKVLPISLDKHPGYIAFEVVSSKDWLNEKKPSRGANCTSVDALIIAEKENGERWLIPIEWKYTEVYGLYDNKSREDRKGEEKGSNSIGQKRVDNYSGLINESAFLKPLDKYIDSIYYYEPFYQLMRQTLWAEQMIKHGSEEWVKADHFLHIHVIPSENKDLLDMQYLCSKKGMEESWRDMLKVDSYQIVSPECLLSPIKANKDYSDLVSYLKVRYW